MILFIAVVPTALVLIALMLVNCVYNRPTHLKRFLLAIMYPVAILLHILLGGEILFLLVMSTIGQWYIGAPIMFVFWVLAFIVLNREYKFPTVVSKETEIEMNESKVVVVPGETGKKENDVAETVGPESKCHKLGCFFGMFFVNIGIGLKRRWWLAIPVIIGLGIVAFGTSLMACNTCVQYYPNTLSTTFSRMLAKQDKICDWNTVCFNYLTVPNDMSSSMIVNYHLYGPNFRNSSVLISEQPLLFANGTLNNTAAARANTTRGNCFSLNLWEEERYQCWSDVTGLRPNTKYYYIPQFLYDDNKIYSTQPFYFITGPGPKDDDDFTYFSGGDLAWSDSGKALINFAVSSKPLFIIVGGDLMYENGDINCFRRVDNWFVNWMNTFAKNGNRSIPLLTCVGNHEGGGFRQPRSSNAFYISYFPHELNLNNTKPNNRRLYHHHQFASHTSITVLDSWVHTDPKDQKTFIGSSLGLYAIRRNRNVLYHSAIYPSKAFVSKSDDDYVVNSIVNNWKPLFDENNVNMIFENHFHSYKVTFPVKNDVIVNNPPGSSTVGTVYVGDGCFGVPPSNSAESWNNSPASALIRQKMDVAHVHRVVSTLNGATLTSHMYIPTTGNVTLIKDSTVQV
jgi:hypothetical protein